MNVLSRHPSGSSLRSEETIISHNRAALLSATFVCTGEQSSQYLIHIQPWPNVSRHLADLKRCQLFLLNQLLKISIMRERICCNSDKDGLGSFKMHTSKFWSQVVKGGRQM